MKRTISTIYDISKHEYEFYSSNTYVRDRMYEMMPDWVHTILDPCAGECGLEYMDDPKYKYTLLDIENRGPYLDEVCDFLKRTPKPGEIYDAVVLNPPFKYTNEFVEQSFKYTNDVFLVAPLKTAYKDYRDEIVNYFGHWTIPFMCYKVLTSIAIFHIHRDSEFDILQCVKKDLRIEKLPLTKTLANAEFNYINHHIENKPFIVHLITKGRILRNEEIIAMTDIHEAGDETVFIATATSANKKTIKGDHIYRNIKYFDSIEDAYAFREKYINNDEYIRNYCYTWGSNLLGLNEIPLL